MRRAPWLALVLAACGANPYARHADRHRPPEWAASCRRSADDALARGRTVEAESWLRQAIELDPSYVAARRDLQDLQISLLRRDEAFEEAEEALDRDPKDPIANYLASRVRGGAARRRLLERALDLDPWCGWARLGLSQWKEDFEGAGAGLRDAEAARGLLPNEPDALLAWLRSSAWGGDRGHNGLALLQGLVLFGDDEPRFAAIAIRDVFLADPGGTMAQIALPSVLGKLGSCLRAADVTVALADAVRGALAPPARRAVADALARARRAGPWSVELEAAHARLEAALAIAAGSPTRARAALERANALGERSPSFLRELRLARVRDGDVAGAARLDEEFLAEFGASVEAPLDPAVARFLAASIAESRTPSPAECFDLARTASAAGWVEESVELLARAEARGLPLAECRDARPTIDGFADFLARLREALRRGGRTSLDLSKSLDGVRALGLETLGFDPVEGSVIEDHFPIGYLLDGRPTAPGLPRLLDAHGFEIRLGKRLLGPAEAFALRRLAARPIEGTILGRRYAGREVLGEGSSLFTELEALGVRFAGTTLPGSVFLVLDPVAEAARDLDVYRGYLASPGFDWRHPRLPVASGPEERLAADEAFGCSARLVLAALDRDPSPLAPRLLDLVRSHEYAHLADAQQYLPLLANAGTLVAWLLQSGFSPSGIEARLELRAELTAMCVARDPELSLAEVLRAAEQPADGRPHSAGFAELARRFVLEADRRSARGALPAIEPGFPVMAQLWRLSPEEIRGIATSLARDEGLVAGPP